MKSRTALLAVLVMLTIVAVWLAAFPIARELPNDAFQEPYGAVYNGLNVLFTALAFGGVVITLLFQVEELHDRRREEIERSIFELFQTFTSLEFQIVKDSAYGVLLAAIKNRDYAEYVASRLHVVGQLAFPESAYETLKKLDPEKREMSNDELIRADREERLRLDNMLNFFALLAQRKSSAEVIKHVDFAYDWWRPALMFLGEIQAAHRTSTPELERYSTTRPIAGTVNELDKVYGHKKDGEDIWAYLTSHPKLIGFDIDSRFRDLLKRPK